MRTTLTLLLAVSLVAAPAAATPGTPGDRPDEGEDLVASARAVAVELVVAEGLPLEAPAPAVQQGRAAGWKAVLGIAMIGGGLGVITKGITSWQDEPDRFGRTKNSDSYLAFGVGSSMILAGVLAAKAGFAGRGFE